MKRCFWCLPVLCCLLLPGFLSAQDRDRFYIAVQTGVNLYGTTDFYRVRVTELPGSKTVIRHPLRISAGILSDKLLSLEASLFYARYEHHLSSHIFLPAETGFSHEIVRGLVTREQVGLVLTTTRQVLSKGGFDLGLFAGAGAGLYTSERYDSLGVYTYPLNRSVPPRWYILDTVHSARRASLIAEIGARSHWRISHRLDIRVECRWMINFDPAAVGGPLRYSPPVFNGRGLAFSAGLVYRLPGRVNGPSGDEQKHEQ